MASGCLMNGGWVLEVTGCWMEGGLVLHEGWVSVGQMVGKYLIDGRWMLDGW